MSEARWCILFTTWCSGIKVNEVFFLNSYCLIPNQYSLKAYYGKKTPRGNEVRDSHEMCLELLRDEQVFTYLILFNGNKVWYTWCLNTLKVALVSGDAFGAPNCVRLSYAASKELITESITRFKKFLLSLRWMHMRRKLCNWNKLYTQIFLCNK